MTAQTSIDVRVTRISYRTPDIHSFELTSLNGADLPMFSAGAHVEVMLPSGVRRPYSLHNRPGDTKRYEIAVKLEAAGRGGSRFLHEKVRVGDVLAISPPINHFELVDGAARYVLVGAGIGVTPIIAMARQLSERGADFVFHYCGRTPESLAFLAEAIEICGDRLRTYVDGGDPARGLDVRRLVEDAAPDAETYCCGPASLIAAVRDATPDARRHSLHFESFAAPASLPGRSSSDPGLEVEIAETGEVIPLRPDQSVLDVLRECGHDVESSCEAGTCGACKTRLLEGEVDHQDFVLADDERREWMMVCVSRPRNGRIKLDLAAQ
jgi:ferredoxin-NADP reductase